MYDYLVKHFKGIYRLKCHYDYNTNDYPRNAEGEIEGNDVYIDCRDNIEITYYGKKILACYIPSIGKGRNIVRKLEEAGLKNIILEYTESDIEVIFYFHVKDIKIIADLVNAKTSGANINAFSVKNLPSSKPKWNKYEPQDKEKYDELIKMLKDWIPKQGMKFGDAYNKFYKEFGKSIKLDIVKLSKNENLKPIHIINKYGHTMAAIDWLSSQ